MERWELEQGLCTRVSACMRAAAGPGNGGRVLLGSWGPCDAHGFIGKWVLLLPGLGTGSCFTPWGGCVSPSWAISHPQGCGSSWIWAQGCWEHPLVRESQRALAGTHCCHCHCGMWVAGQGYPMGAGHMWPFLGETWFRGTVVLPDVDLASPAFMEQFNNPPQPSDPSECPECLGHGKTPFQELYPILESPQSSGLLPPSLTPHSIPFQQLERSLQGENLFPSLFCLG